MKEDKSRPVGKSISLEDLAKEQGVVPAVDLDEIASLWPWMTIRTNCSISS